MPDDDDDKGPKKNNTDRDFKPENGKRDDHTPRGAVGRPSAGLNGPGLGTSSSRQERFAETQDRAHDVDRDESGRIVFRKSQEQSAERDTRPVALDTDDLDVNQQTDAQGERRMPMDEIKREAGTDRTPEEKEREAAAEERRAENQGVLAPITGDEKIDQQSRDDGYTLVDQDEYDQSRAEAIQAQLTKQKEQDKDLDR